MSPILLAIACLFAVTFGYVWLCAVSPFATCRTCDGFGYLITTDRRGRIRRGKDCRRCKATGKRIRVGRHLYNLWAAVYRDGIR